MTAEKLHDAITLLPGDLVAATDRLRAAPKARAVHWKRWTSLAACLVLLLSAGMVFQQKILSDMGGARMESVTGAPAAMEAAAESQKVTSDAAAPEESAAELPVGADLSEPSSETGIPEIPAEEEIRSESGMEEALCIDHSHRFAEAVEGDRNAVGYCGNMMTTISLDGMEYSFAGSDSVAVTDILINLDYDPDAVCRCMAEFTVDTEMISGIEVNLTDGFARCSKGQAPLTEKQAQTIREIIEKLQ